MTVRKVTCTALIAALVVSGCATPQGGAPAANNANSADSAAMRCAMYGLGGALLGAGLGGKSGMLKGAALGLAACAVVEIASRQTKSANEVEQAYRVSNRNQLPASPKIDAFTTIVTPAGAVKAGDAIRIESMVRAVSGSAAPVQEVKQVLVAYSPDGQEFKRGEKKLNEVAGSGEYVNSFTLKLPANAPQGVYRFETLVYLNGQQVTKRDSSVQVAADGRQALLAMRDH